MKIMDCTFRESYYFDGENWDADMILKGVSLLYDLVDLIEIGYIKDGGFVHRSLGDDLTKYKDKLCLMVDLKDYILKGKLVPEYLTQSVNISFPEEPFFKYVRVATTIENIEEAKKAVWILHSYGYKVFISLMKCSTIHGKCDIKELPIEALYYADSFGGDRTLSKKLLNIGGGKAGYHSHNNVGLSFVRYLECIDKIDYFDSSLLGLGRGAGNCDTLQILTYFNLLTKEIYDYSEQYIRPIKEKYKCGPSLAYQYSGQNNIHPSYVVYLKEQGLNDFEIIEKLKTTNPDETTNYNEKLAKSLLS